MNTTKNKPTHTPGPWGVLPLEPGTGYLRVRGTIPGTRWKIANVLYGVYEDYSDLSQRELKEAKANALLIAAAPELLEALKAVVEDWELTVKVGQAIQDSPCTRAIVRAAIRKATGGDPQ